MRVGTLVIGDDIYVYTNKNVLCIVTEFNLTGDDDINVKIIACEDSCELGSTFPISSSNTTKITVDEYFEQHPNAHKVEDFDEIIEKYSGCEPEEESDPEPEEKPEPLVLTDSEYIELLNEIMELLNQYHYPVTEEGCRKIIDKWIKNKGSLINLMKKHPNYNGKYQIAFDQDYERTIDKRELITFRDYVIELYEKSIEEIKVSCMTYPEACDIYGRVKDIYDYMTLLRQISGYEPKINGNGIDYYEKEVRKFRRIVNSFDNLYYNTSAVYYINTKGKRILLTDENNDKVNSLISFFQYLKPVQFLDENMANNINYLYPDAKARKGQKLSRVVNKVCHIIGVDKDKDYNKMFAKFSDAVNPLSIVRHTVLSCHPIDYLTMSFGNSWASCHTIDKFNERKVNSSNNYHGQYSGGTLSYLLDGTSMVFYTVDKSYNGNEYELQPKINRNMFHFGNDKLIQGRVYPQSNDDDENGIYAKIRNIVQKIMADCLGVDNLWTLKKGVMECESMVSSKGVHYRDYANYNSCNVSYLKRDGKINKQSIIVGHDGICPKCGDYHNNEENILCEYCEEDYTNIIDDLGIEYTSV